MASNGVCRPIKVCNANRSKKIGLMASSIEDVKNKWSKYSEVEQTISIVEEDDGTLVEDDAYFQSLPDFVLLMVLLDGQSWIPSQVTAGYHHPASTSGHLMDQTDSVVAKIGSVQSDLERVAQKINSNYAYVTMLTEYELDLIVEASCDVIAKLINIQMFEANELQEYCNRKLKDSYDLKDGLELLKLYRDSL